MDRAQDTEDLTDLDSAIQKLEEVVVLMLLDHPNRAEWLQNLAMCLVDRYHRLADLKDLKAALQRQQELVDLTPMDYPDRGRQLQNLAVSFGNLYQRLGDPTDLEHGLQRSQESVDLTPADHPNKAVRLQNLATSLMDRYQRFGNLEDLEAALQQDQEVMDLTPADHPDRADRLQDLAVSFTERYQKLKELKDLETAVTHYQEAVDLTSADHMDRADRLHRLAMSFRERYRRSGDLKDLESAVQKDQEAVDLTPEDHPDRASRLLNLAASLGDRYQRLSDMQDLEAGLRISQQAVDMTPGDHPNKAMQLHSLGVSFKDRYQRLGDLKDLESALQNKQQAVDLTPEDYPDRGRRLQSLATSFRDRYQRLADLKDLQSALQNSQQAVDLTSADHPDRASWLGGLALSLTDRYHRFRNLEDLEAALQRGQEGLDLTTVDHPDRARWLQNLAALLGDRYRRLDGIQDLEAALERYQHAVDLTPKDHPGRASMLHGLAVSFGDRYQRLGDLTDLKAALQRHQESVDLAPTNHPDRPERLQNLAFSFAERFRRFKKPEDMKQVHKHYIDSFKTGAFSTPEDSWWAALRWASFSKEFQPTYCSAAYSAAFNLLPELLWMGHTIPVQQDAIQRLDIGKTTSAATRISLTLSDPISAVQFFEQGLATTFQQMLQLRPDLDILPVEQAETLKKLSSELYSGASQNPSRVACERQELLQAIRKQPGLKHFLCSRPYKVLCQASQGGPVVLLNSHDGGCDGIIILNPAADPVHVQLPNVTLDSLKLHQSALKELLRHCNLRTRWESASPRLFGHREGFRSRTIEEHFTDLLTWLWSNVVEPIYQVLASHDIHKGRLWWLPSGSFTGLPLHACPPTDEFIHSYTATLGSLLEAQAKRPVTTQCKVGVVGVTHTGLRRANYLKGVEQEVEKIRSIVQDPNLECLEGEQATPAAVQNQIQTCSWVHLACHGTQDLMEPTKSRLLLYDGALELEAILKMPLSNAELVFLAACQTAMGDAELVNESFHLGGGFIAAGFRGAIGTMWSMNDQDGPVVAETVYSHLFGDGRQPQASDAAEALQLAVNKLKAQNVPHERWIPFIHMGV
ncbi:CHAT domain-containing protein [Mycena maculata]|uniref:CHAT domain-containing protein n=1 Tax=Mycena maculata TaxID=230809 RepID=A0AAD7H8I3_9AGAR|nr:CHAT domain-containing protein [Mycena maculata]